MIKMMLIAGAGGFAGTCCRFLVGRWCSTLFHMTFPVGTFLVNIIGCFLIGLVLGMLEKSAVMSTTMRLLLVTGFCGGFTTFSAFADELWTLGNKGEWGITAFYLASSVIVGIFLVGLGRILVR